jgi:anti-anti-sigma factor
LQGEAPALQFDIVFLVTARISLFKRLETAVPDLVTLVAKEPDGCMRLATTGDLTGADVAKVGKNPFAVVLGEQWAECRVVLDFRETHFIDSAAIGWLIDSQREFRKNKGILAVHSVERRVFQTLKILNMDKVFLIVADEPAAREAARGA